MNKLKKMYYEHVAIYGDSAVSLETFRNRLYKHEPQVAIKLPPKAFLQKINVNEFELREKEKEFVKREHQLLDIIEYERATNSMKRQMLSTVFVIIILILLFIIIL